MRLLSVSSHWEIADRFAEYLQDQSIDCRVVRHPAFHVEVAESDWKRADQLATDFNPDSVVTELLGAD